MASCGAIYCEDCSELMQPVQHGNHQPGGWLQCAACGKVAQVSSPAASSDAQGCRSETFGVEEEAVAAGWDYFKGQDQAPATSRGVRSRAEQVRAETKHFEALRNALGDAHSEVSSHESDHDFSPASSAASRFSGSDYIPREDAWESKQDNKAKDFIDEARAVRQRQRRRDVSVSKAFVARRIQRLRREQGLSPETDPRS